MKRILLSCFLLTATCSAVFVQNASAQSSAATVTASGFTAKVNQLDAQIASGEMAAAQATWGVVHQMMITELGITKHSIMGAATPEAKATLNTLMKNQRDAYAATMPLKTDLAANRAALHTKLGQFATLIQ